MSEMTQAFPSCQGVVSTHANVLSQVRTLVDAWEWSSQDVIYNVLPLHHIHGIINVVTCALYSGACVEMSIKFDAHAVVSMNILKEPTKKRR